jgi:RNA polymerase sigma-70 factor (ECF subfamily)
MDDKEQKAFLELYAANQRRLYGYIVTLVPNRSDAEEVFSQTLVVLWEKWTKYDPAWSFLSWACGVARYEVLKYLHKPERRWGRLNEQVVAMLSADRDKLQDCLDRRAAFLAPCIEKLKEDQRILIKKCYSGAMSIAEIARRLGKTPNSVSSQLRRIREGLHRCVDRAMREEDRS